MQTPRWGRQLRSPGPWNSRGTHGIHAVQFRWFSKTRLVDIPEWEAGNQELSASVLFVFSAPLFLYRIWRTSAVNQHIGVPQALVLNQPTNSLQALHCWPCILQVDHGQSTVFSDAREAGVQICHGGCHGTLHLGGPKFKWNWLCSRETSTFPRTERTASLSETKSTVVAAEVVSTSNVAFKELGPIPAGSDVWVVKDKRWGRTQERATVGRLNGTPARLGRFFKTERRSGGPLLHGRADFQSK